MSNRPDRWHHIESLFEAAVDLEPRARSAFLDNCTGDDASLRREIESLIAAHEAASDFMERPAFDASNRSSKEIPPTDVHGRNIGPYRLQSVLGTGGMGVVYEAEQQNPRRSLALKVIRIGGDQDDHRLKLFQRETQSLARMRHPSIATIHEAGCTEDGQHYFAMELIRGEPLNKFVRNNSLNQRARIELFLQLCDAIGYAHQRGVIHRDLKPSNILVTVGNQTNDSCIAGKLCPAVKVLDFGLARMTDSDTTLFTTVSETGRIMGTLPYMSPEQARGIKDDIDIRSDVYSLAVILYELVTDELPYDLNGVLQHEGLRIIRESAPRRPSSIRRSCRGDLETIILKGLEKDPARRYQSVAILADDLRRFLSGEPISARPPSTSYQIRKLVARHKLPFAFVATLLLLLTGFSIFVTYQAAKIADQRDHANKARREAEIQRDRANRTSQYFTSMIAAARPGLSRGHELTVREFLDQGARRVRTKLTEEPDEVRAAFQDMIGLVYLELGRLSEANHLINEALNIRQSILGQEHVETITSLYHLALLRQKEGNFLESEKLYREALYTARDALGEDDPGTMVIQRNLAAMLIETGDVTQAEVILRRVLDAGKRRFGENAPEVMGIENDLAATLLMQERWSEAETMFKKLEDRYRSAANRDDFALAPVLLNLGNLYFKTGRNSEAEAKNREAASIVGRIFGEESIEYAKALRDLSFMLRHSDRLKQAEVECRKALALHEKLLDDDHYQVAQSRVALGQVLLMLRRPVEAEPLLRVGLESLHQSLGDEHAMVNVALHALVDCLFMNQKYIEAEQLLRHEFRLNQQAPVENLSYQTRMRLGLAFLHQEKLDEAITHLRGAMVLCLQAGHDGTPDHCRMLKNCAEALIGKGEYQDAEAMVRKCLATRKMRLPKGHRLIANAESVLGEALCGQGKYETAEPLLLNSYRDLKSDSQAVPKAHRKALKRIVKLYKALGQHNKADGYQASLESIQD